MREIIEPIPSDSSAYGLLQAVHNMCAWMARDEIRRSDLSWLRDALESYFRARNKGIGHSLRGQDLSDYPSGALREYTQEVLALSIQLNDTPAPDLLTLLAKLHHFVLMVLDQTWGTTA